jgi:nuclear GTP-binding protein
LRITTEPKKDPGIPNLYPFKEELLHKMELQKAKMEDEKERQKKNRALEIKKKRETSLQSLAADANKRTKDFDMKAQEEAERQIHAQLYDIKGTTTIV